MPRRATITCPRCRRTHAGGIKCPTCAARQPYQYDYKGGWPARRAEFLDTHRWCALCGKRAKVADHYPISRRELVRMGVLDPDADHRLRPLCIACHNTRTAATQGGFGNP